MMDVCRKAQTEIKESKEYFDISPIMSSFSNPDTKSPIERNGCDNEVAGIKTANCNVKRTHNCELKAEENFDKENSFEIKIDL